MSMTLAAISLDPLIWIAALLTLCIFSFLYRDNIFYRFAEHLLVGLSTGYFFLVLVYQVFYPKVIVRIRDATEWWDIALTVFVACLGFLMLSRLPLPFLRPWGWLSRWPMALAVGIGSGMAIPPTLEADILRQVMGAVGVSVIPSGDIAWYLAIGNVVLVVGTVAALVYFFFSMPHTGLLGGTAKVGIWVLMLGFGASFGYTVMARLSLFIGRVLFLLRDWLGVITT
jgi:hypothetical protein